MGRRSEQRVQASLPVRVWGMDPNGNPFLQSAYTIDITQNGARLRDLFCVAKTGEVICLQHGSRKAKFTVQWIGHPGTAGYGHIGLHCMEPGKYIWSVPLPEIVSPDTFALSHAEPLSSPEHRAAAGASSSNGCLVLTEEAEETPRATERRIQIRIPCNGTVEVGPEGSSMPIWCGLCDLSASGCYAETPTPLPAKTRVYIRLRVFGVQIMSHGSVCNSHPGIGMGIALSEMTDEDRERLHSVLAMLENKSRSAPAAVAEPRPVSFGSQPTSAPWQDRSLLLVHNRPQQQNVKKPPAADPELLRRLAQLSAEMEELPPFIPGSVDVRILQEFKTTMDYARQMAGLVQLWMELESQNRDPFHLIHQLNEERVQSVSTANQRLATDLDGGEIDFDTSGLKELYQSASDLNTRLQKLFKKK